MNICVAVTDRDWFDFLAAQCDIDEVNLWQPNPWGGEFGVLRRVEPRGDVRVVTTARTSRQAPRGR